MPAEASASERPGSRARSTSSDAAFLLVARVLAMGATFAAGVATARVFPTGLRGEYAMLATIAAFVSTFASLGFPESVVYFFRRGEAAVTRTLTTIAVFNLAVALVVLALAPLLSPWIAETYLPVSGEAVAWAALGAGVCAIIQRSCLAYQQAIHAFVRTGLVWLLQPVAFLVALGAIHASGADFPWVGLWFAGSWAFAAALVFVPMLPRLRLGSLDRAHLGKVVRFSLKSHANVAMSQLNYRLDMFVVAYLVSDLGQLAFYHVAASLAGLIWLLPDTYGVALYPRLAGAGSARERTRQVIEALRLVGLVSIAAAAALAALAGWGVPLLFGAPYAASVLPVLVLLPGVVLMAGTKILSRQLLSENRHQWSAVCSLVGVVVNVAANLVLVPRYGVVGAAGAATIAYIVTSLGMLAAALPGWQTARDDWTRFPARELVMLRQMALDGLRRRRGR
jgi:O-antigen/teichoic acid export membrane protein